MSHNKPRILFSSNHKLFESFVTPAHEQQLTRIADWERASERGLTAGFRKQLKDIDGLITTWDSPPHFAEELLEWAPRLQIISHCGGGVKTRFARSLFERLVITNAASPMSRHVAELAVTFLLYFAREIDDYRELLRGRSNAVYEQMHVSGGGDQTILNREVGIIGFGRIGRAIVDLLSPFGTRVRVHDPYVAGENLPPNVIADSLENVLAASDFLIVAAGLTEETAGMLNRKRLLLLPRNAAVINVARGGIIDLHALTKLVLKHRLRCALDVTDPLEPLPVGHPLRRARGAILTPHVGAISRSVRHEITSIVLGDLGRFFSGKPVENRVTATMLDRMT
jgi:phosphoglycerate dehydrogenase-like enzyme